MIWRPSHCRAVLPDPAWPVPVLIHHLRSDECSGNTAALEVEQHNASIPPTPAAYLENRKTCNSGGQLPNAKPSDQVSARSWVYVFPWTKIDSDAITRSGHSSRTPARIQPILLTGQIIVAEGCFDDIEISKEHSLVHSVLTSAFGDDVVSQ